MASSRQHGILTGILFLLSLSNNGMQRSDAAEVFTSSDPNGLKASVFLSPEIVMEPGSVANKFFDNVDFPKGHIAIKEFYAEMVDESGASIPLHHLYVHHFLLIPCKQKKNKQAGFTAGHQIKKKNRPSECFSEAKPGKCRFESFGHYFGAGSELRRTLTRIPDPYGREAGNPAVIMPGYEETWMLNVHVIDMRGVEDPLGCAECRCDLYNITNKYNVDGRPYLGGYACCEGEGRCRLRNGDPNSKTSVYLRYTIKWIDWSPSVVPVIIYTLDVTDSWRKADPPDRRLCQVEYDVPPCNDNGGENYCTHIRRATVPVPKGGRVIYAVGHQHIAGTGISLHGEDGRVICKSMPIYGRGSEPGDEAGHIVGMSACYPKPGSVVAAVSDGEILTVESNYSSARLHTGVMGVFSILVADNNPETTAIHPTKHSLMMDGIIINQASS